MFDDIIMNILGKNSENQHMEVVDIYFEKQSTTTFSMYIGSRQDFYWKKSNHESLDGVRPYYNV